MINASLLLGRSDDAVSEFLHWNEKSAVRAKPYEYDCMVLAEQEIGDKNWFIPSVLSYLEHPAIKHLDDALHQNLLARNLVTFLEYTTVLEHKIVNRSVEVIAHDVLPVPIPFAMRMSALKLYADEGYHAVISADVSRQVALLFHLDVPSSEFERIKNFQKLIEGFPVEFKNLGWFLIGFVAETVITKEFLQMAKATLVPPVYRMLRDHLEDEWRHSHFFSSMFSYLWGRLNRNERYFCKDALPLIIFESFRLEDGWLERNLIDLGLNNAIAEEIETQRNSHRGLLESARCGSMATLKALHRAGFFLERANLERFFEFGLIEEDSEFFR